MEISLQSIAAEMCIYAKTGLPQSGKKVWKIFQVREKSWNFNFSQGNLEKVVKVREKSGNLRIFKKVHC